MPFYAQSIFPNNLTIGKEQSEFRKNSLEIPDIESFANTRSVDAMECLKISQSSFKNDGPEASDYLELNENYVINNKHVYYVELDYLSRKNVTCKMLIDADSETFQIMNSEFGKDSKYVFRYGSYLKKVDAKTFRIANSYLAYDRFHVYQLKNTQTLKILPQIDLLSFKSFEGSECYADRSGVHCVTNINEWESDLGGEGKISGADPKTFQVLGFCSMSNRKFWSYYGKDQNQVFCGNRVIPEADPKSFRLIAVTNCSEYPCDHLGIAVDKNCVWSAGVKVADKNGKCLNPKNSDAYVKYKMKENSDDAD